MNLLLHGDYSFFFKKGNKSIEKETFKLQKPARKGFCVLHLALVLGFLYVAMGGANAQTIRYVMADATGTGTTSWANASGDLQEMINSSAAGDQVWVAAGTYYPNRRPDNLTVITPKDLNNAFVLQSNVKIYGGFAGNETSLKQRDSTRATNNTLLSGDVVTTSWHLYHVVMSVGEVGTAELNSFTISGGNANGNAGSGSQPTFGGGLYISSSSPVLSNITISGNTATDYGGGICIYSSSPVLSNVIISGNKASYGGGICNFSESSPVLTNVIISGNLANYGGGMFNYQSSSPVLTNITISGNNATYGGGVGNFTNSSPKIRNTIIYGNSSGIWNNDGAYSKPIISYSLVQGSADTMNGNIDGSTNPKFVIPTGGDYRLQRTSPLINAGNNAYFNVGQVPDLSQITTDLDDHARIQGTIIDLGAYESAVPLPPNLNYAGVNASYITGTAITDIIPTVTGTPLIGNGSFSNTITTPGSGFSYPTGVAVDAAGNVYVADQGHNAVKEILANHLADGTTPSTIGSGFKYPYGVAVDVAGNVYVADYGNGVVKEIPAGHLTDGSTPEIIGNGFKNPYGVAVDVAGNVYVADFGNSEVKVIPAGHLTDGTTPTTIGSGFKNPTGVAVDGAGNVYVADNGNGLVKEIPAHHLTDGTSPVTIGSGFSNPYSVAVDAAGNVYVADQVNGIKEIPAGHLTDGTTPVTIGSAFNQPLGVATDAAGNVYVADYGNNAVKELKATIYSISPPLPAGLSIDAITGVISGTPATATPATSYTITTQNAGGATTAIISFATLTLPPTLSYTGVNDFYNIGTAIPSLIPAVTGTPLIGNGSISNIIATIGSGFTNPTGVAVDAAGNIYVADNVNGVEEIPAGHLTDGTTPVKIGKGFTNPSAVAVDATGNVYVADYGNKAIYKIPAGHLTDGTTPVTIGSGFNHPNGIAVDASGNVYVADYGNSEVNEIPATHLTDGTIPITLGSGFYHPTGVAVDASGNVYVADRGNGMVKEIPAAHLTDGTIPTPIGSGFNYPFGVAVDAAGNIYVANNSSSVVYEIPANHLTDGTAPVTIGSGFSNPFAVAVDAAGNLYVADYGIGAVKELKATIYSISPSLPAGLSIDAITGVISGTPAIASPATSYTITTQNAVGATTATISFGVWSVLSVKWIKVDGSLNSSNNAVLNWKVEEQNIARFHVQKSSNGINFTTIGSLNSKGNGTNSYTYIDVATDNENSFYRIEETDKDGKSNFSPIISLKSTKTSTITIYPNPTEGPLTILVPNSLVGTNAVLTDVTGKTISIIKLSNNSNLINLGKLASDIYFLKFADGTVKEIIRQ